MEQPPGSIDDLQPQDLSTSSNATVIDLTRKGEECVRGGATSVDALQMVQSPGWCLSSGAGNPGLTSDITLQSGDQIQPDNAFSHTTVTLSYVSRSHVFSSHGSLSQPSPLCGMPAISKLPLNPPCHSDGGLGKTGLPLNQHYLEQVDGPVDFATQTELFQSSSQAQVGPESYGPVLETHEVNGGVVSGDWDVDENARGREEHSLSWGKNKGLENGQIDSWSSSGACAESSPETLTPATVEDDETGGSDMLFLVSKNKESAVHPDSLGSRELGSLEREYISPLDDPVSPSAISQDDVEDVFVLPQASSSPSGDNSYLETADEAAWDGASTEGANLLDSSVSGSATTRLDSSDNNKQPVQRQKAASVPLIDLTQSETHDVCASDDLESTAKTAAPHVNGNAKALQRALEDKKLLVRSGRGTRLESIAMDINSSRYTVSGCIRTNKKANQSTACDSKFTDAKHNNIPSAGKRARRAKAPVTVEQTAASPVKGGKPNNVNTDSFKDSTSDSEVNNSKKPQSSTPPKSPQFAAHKNADKQPEQLSPPEPLAEGHMARNSTPPSKSPKKSQGRAKGKSTGSKTPPTAKRKGAHTPRKRRKKHKQSPSSSMFSPKEPEIKLRYINYKEEKRDFRSDSFSPFIRVERRQSSPSLCTIINYPEEVRTQHKKGQPAQPGGFISATVPSSSCLQLGRVTTHSQHQRSLVCCLCGLSANAMDLGDLHGPYYPEGFQPTTKTPASSLGLREDEDDNDSDASSCSIRDRRRKQAIPHAPRPQRPGVPLKGRGLLARQRWGTDGPGTPPAKRARVSDAGSVNTEDWYNPPLLPLEPCEYWLHEDCGIWSTGVFLVKGRVYGLEEAVKVAQETVKLHSEPVMWRNSSHVEMWLTRFQRT